MSENNFNKRPVSIFWPVLLIGVGILLLLSNLGLISAVDMFLLLRLWPLMLVALGVNIMFGRDYPWLSNLLSIALVAAAIAFLFLAPSLGIKTPSQDFITEEFSVPIDEASAAIVHIDTDRGALTVTALEDSRDLFEAEVTHNEVVTLTTTGSKTKTIELDLKELDFIGINSWFVSEQISTIVGLSTRVPVSLNIDHGSGPATLDLSGLLLEELEADTGSGSLTVTLPGGSYPANLDTGSGTLTIETEPNADINLMADVGSGRIFLDLASGSSGDIDLDSGSGSVSVKLPSDVGVRISGSTGSGGVSVPNGYIRTRGSDSPGSSTRGTWESPNFDSAEIKLYIEFSVGSGSIRFND